MRVKPIKSLAFFGLITTFCFVFTGCAPKPESTHYDICVLVDHSASTRKNPQFANALRQVSKVYLSLLRTGPNNEVSLLHGGITSEIVYDGKGKGLNDLRDKLNGLADEHESKVAEGDKSDSPHIDTSDQIASDEHGCGDGLCNGSPIVETLLEPARSWINDRPKNSDKMIIIVSDLIADPTKYKDGRVKKYSPPPDFKWNLREKTHVHIRFYGVDMETKNKLRDAWGSDVDMRFFEAGHSVDKTDIDPLDASK